MTAKVHQLLSALAAQSLRCTAVPVTAEHPCQCQDSGARLQAQGN